MNKQRGFTLLELIVVIAVVIILASVVLPKFVRLLDRAEVSAVQGMMGQMRSALSLQMSRGLYRGDELGAGDDGGSQALYPMHDLLLETPENYLGVLETSDRRGCWYDDKNSHELVYVLRDDTLVDGAQSTPATLRWQITIIHGSVVDGGQRELIGLVLQSSTPTQWRVE